MSNTSIQNKQRSLSIDMVKGLSIMSLFFLHFENGWMPTEYNYFIVRSPSFYFVVGWLWGMSSNKKTIRGHWSKRKEGLVKPFLWLSLIFICFDAVMVMLGQYNLSVLGRDIYKTVTLRGIGTLWFLPALLGGEMLFIYFRDRNLIAKIFLLAISFSIIFLFNKYSLTPLAKNSILDFAIKSPLNVLSDCSNAFIHIFIAYAISSRYGKQIFNSKNIYLSIAGILLLAVSFYAFNFFSSQYLSIQILAHIAANIVVSTGILSLFRSLECFKPLSMPLSYCGKNSLTIMAFHFCILLQLAIIIDKNVLGYTSYYGGRTIIYFLIALLLEVAIIEIINKRFRFIIGKN